MSTARDAILGAIGATLSRRRGARPAADAAAVAAEAALLRARADVTRPDRVDGRPDEVFLKRVVAPAIGATTERVAALADVPDATRRYLAQRGLAAAVALQPHPELLALDWSGIETHTQLGVDEPVVVGLALGAIAETATLVFHSSATSPTLFAFLPLHHIVAVAADRIWPWLEDYADALVGAAQPRNINLVTGPSATTDIEGTLVRGAHGPGWLHIVLVGQYSSSSR
jgi:L-lactate dehydrogenase complex protein LldG